jgi:hypothetical protein
MKISLLLPTRGRPQFAQRLLQSVVNTAGDIKDIEVVLFVDEDDPDSHTIAHPLLSIAKIVGAPGQTMGLMNNACAKASCGRYLMLINDDAVFRTRQWDRRIRESFAAFPDDVALVYGNDLDQGIVVPTFPVVSRVFCDVLGELCPQGYRNLHIESHLLDIFKELGRRNHHRICYLPDVVVEHMHHVLGKAALDATYRKKDQRRDDWLFIALDDDRALEARRLARYIEARQSAGSR